jgi:uncharacterized membrane protein YhaH (DUF805 family)
MTEPSFNQYAAPAAEVADVNSSYVHSYTEVGEVNLFSATGRIGRLRFLAYITGSAMLCNAVGNALGSLAILVYIPYLWFGVLTGIKRCHDVDMSGWWSFLTIIPLLGLLWALVPGNKGVNRFGPPPPPNTTGVRLLGVILPALFVIGIVAAVAIPQYKHYVDKAKAAQAAQHP